MVRAVGAAACPFCGSDEVYVEEYEHHPGAMRWRMLCVGCMAGIDTGIRQSAGAAVQDWNRRAECTWHDFSDELPPAGASVLCRGKNGALYVGKPVTLKGNVTRKVWVPRGDQYRTPEKWMEVSA